MSELDKLPTCFLLLHPFCFYGVCLWSLLSVQFFSQKTILPSPWPERQPRKHVTFSPHPPQTACTYVCVCVYLCVWVGVRGCVYLCVGVGVGVYVGVYLCGICYSLQTTVMRVSWRPSRRSPEMVRVIHLLTMYMRSTQVHFDIVFSKRVWLVCWYYT